MQKTVIFTNIDGHDIISGFGEAVIERVETDKIVMPLLKETEEWTAVEAKKAEYAKACEEFLAARSSGNEKAYRNALMAMENIQEEAQALAPGIQKRLEALRRENAVYFKPRNGEETIDEAEALRLRQAILKAPEGSFVSRGGNFVPDNRGTVYYQKRSGAWKRIRIVKLGDKKPDDGFLEADLTDIQREEINKDRVAALTPQLKLKERGNLLQSALKSAAEMRVQLEIQGDQDALQKSQKWYAAEVERLEALYS